MDFFFFISFVSYLVLDIILTALVSVKCKDLLLICSTFSGFYREAESVLKIFMFVINDS